MKNVLVTGGTGSFGNAFVKQLLEQKKPVERIVVFSRDELKQWEMQQQFPKERYPQMRYMLGDVRDRDRLRRALEGVDTVVHAAALKQVPAAEYNPIEFVNTNVLGAENVVQACLDTGVQRVVALSTDKAAAPINLYGATKLCSDKLFIAANNIRGSRDIRFSVVRYGNVMGSRGSVIPLFLKQAKHGTLNITDPKMTRFNISLREGVEMVKWSIENACGGEILVPKIPSYSLQELAHAIGPNCCKKVVGVRPGEKIHEEMITTSDSNMTIDIGDYYAITSEPDEAINNFKSKGYGARQVPAGYSYNSGTNPEFLNYQQIRRLIKENVDNSFEPC